MIDKQQLLKRIDEDFDFIQKKQISYKAYVSSAIEWWEENVITKEGSGFIGNKIKFKEAECMCIEFCFSPAALLFAITLQPMESNKNIGSGIGLQHEIKF